MIAQRTETAPGGAGRAVLRTAPGRGSACLVRNNGIRLQRTSRPFYERCAAACDCPGAIAGSRPAGSRFGALLLLVPAKMQRSRVKRLRCKEGHETE